MIFYPSLRAHCLASAGCSTWHITDTHIFVVLIDGWIMPCECLYRHTHHSNQLSHQTVLGYTEEHMDNQEWGLERCLCEGVGITTLGPVLGSPSTGQHRIFSHSQSIKDEVHRILPLGKTWVGFCLPVDSSVVLSWGQHSRCITSGCLAGKS